MMMTRLSAYVSTLPWPPLTWRDIWHSRSVQYALLLVGLCIVETLAVAVIPASLTIWAVFIRVYVAWMMPSLMVGFIAHTRWWLTWMVGTMLFEAGLLVVFGWQLMELAAVCP
jgi:hypothetical protein